MTRRFIELVQRHGALETAKILAPAWGADVPAVAHFLGVPLDLLGRIEISPASLSILAVHDWGAQVLRLNDTGDA